MKYLKPNSFILVVILFFPSIANSQSYVVVGPESEMSVDGTSTLHDWHSEFINMEGTAIITIGDNKITDISEMVLKISVESFESGKSGMEKNAKEALKESEFPIIQFALTRLEKIDGNEILGIGLLTIAGVTRDVSMNVSYSISNAANISFEGSLDLNMTHFEIEPPTVLLGTIKTGDPISINYKVIFKKN